MVVELSIEGGCKHGYIRVGLSHGQGSFRRCNQTDEPDLLCASLFEKIHRGYRRTARRQHRVEDDEQSSFRPRRKLTVVFDRLKALLVTVEAHMSNPSTRDETNDRVDHTQTRTKNRHGD